MGELPIIGPQQIKLTVSKLCVRCLPNPVPAIVNYGGHSLCQKCINYFVIEGIEPNKWHHPKPEKKNVGEVH